MVKRKHLNEEFALLSENHGKRTKKYGKLWDLPNRSLAENGTGGTRSAEKIILQKVDELLLSF